MDHEDYIDLSIFDMMEELEYSYDEDAYAYGCMDELV